MSDLQLVTNDFINQLLYHTSIREAMIGIPPEESTLVYELVMFRDYTSGSRVMDFVTSTARVEAMRDLIRTNHARVKDLVDMADSGGDKQQIINYIKELYREAEDALAVIEEVDGNGQHS